MTTQKPLTTSLPHHTLVGYRLALELVQLIAGTRVADAQLRAQAPTSAASAALNCAEGAARESRADKRRVYVIALAEACELAPPSKSPPRCACSQSDVAAVTALVVELRRVMRPLAR